MTRLLRIPNEARFVRAFALAIDPGDTLSLLLEIGALGSRDLSLVRRTREALIPAYDRASDVKDWDQTHTISVLRERWPNRTLRPTWPTASATTGKPRTRPPNTPKPWPWSAVRPTP